tara:strand:- start:2582 stop:2761 length:180 start_codon:yes stop_codon:yes gene_type:complete
MEYTKNQIKKLGSKIRKEYQLNDNISDESLELLHEYRVSFKEPMTKIFKIVTSESRNID